jgi:hypothetical protein
VDEQTIIRIAQEAGIYYRDDYEFCEIDRDGVPMEMMAKFAALVAAAEREACAKLCEEIKCGMWEGSKKHRDTRLRDASDGAGTCTYAIRARGESK